MQGWPASCKIELPAAEAGQRREAMGKTFEQIMEELSQELEGLTIDERLRLARMCVPGDPEFEVDNDGQLVLYTSAYSDDVD